MTNEELIRRLTAVREALHSEHGWTALLDDVTAILSDLAASPVAEVGARVSCMSNICTADATYVDCGACWCDKHLHPVNDAAIPLRTEVERRARLFSLAPIRDMQRRGWITQSDDTTSLEGSLSAFFGDSLDSGVAFPVAAKRTVQLSELSVAERAWCFRARQLAAVVPVDAPFSARRLPSAERRLREAAAFPKESRKVGRILSEHGIRFVVIEPLPGVKIDGAAFWLDKNSPVIAVSIRYDRIDTFWFTVMHEFKHIEHGDSYSFDLSLIAERDGKITISLAQDSAEERANASAADSLIPGDELKSFIRRLAPLYSRERIIQFAHRMKIHPGIIVGQLQYRGELGYSAHRELLVKIRSVVTETALTDGWGQSISPLLV